MNKSDSELMELSLIKNGFLPASLESEADVVIYNTCSVRQHAENRATARIRSIRPAVNRKNGIIVVTGCMAQRIGTKLVQDGLAHLVIGPYQSPKIGEIVGNYLEGNKGRAFLSQETADFQGRLDDSIAAEHEGRRWHEWVTITHGCENYCAYCIVPYVRGRLISFRSQDILRHITSLAANGVKEITLLGQNVNQFGHDSGDIPFYALLEKTARIEGLVRINYLTSHPKDFDPEIIGVMRDHENISRSIHLPLQSGSDKILASMNRKYTLDRYLSIVALIDSGLEDYSITTDLIVGFPGEEESDFAATMEAVRRVRFDDAFMYAYSPREGTPSADLRELLTREEKIARLNELISVQRAISREKLEARINRIEELIPERISRHSGNEIMGKTFLNHPAVFPGDNEDIGRYTRIKILGINGSTLQGMKIAG